MADASRVHKAGTTIVTSEDAFQPVKPRYRPPNNQTAVEVTTPHSEKHMYTPVSVARRAAKLKERT